MSPIASALGLSLGVAATATLLTGVPAVLLGYALARRQFTGKSVVSALVGLPLVLPPTAVGFLLLKLLAHNGPLAGLWERVHVDFLLDWKGAVLAAAVMSFPLVVRTARVTFEGIDPRLESMSRTLGRSRVQTFLEVSLPLARRGLWAGLILGFTRALGEYGATVTVAGAIPHRTQTLSSAIHRSQLARDDATAYGLMVIAMIIGFVAIWASERLAREPEELRVR